MAALERGSNWRVNLSMAIYNQVKWFGIKPTVKTAQNGGTAVSVDTAGVTILAANDDRTSFYIENRGTDSIYIRMGSGATTSDLELAPGDVAVCDDYTGEVSGIAASGTQEVYVIEL